MNLKIANLYYSLFNLNRGNFRDHKMGSPVDVAMMKVLLDNLNMPSGSQIDLFSLEKDYKIDTTNNLPFFKKFFTKYLAGQKNPVSSVMVNFKLMQRRGVAIPGELGGEINHAAFMASYRQLLNFKNLNDKKKHFFVSPIEEQPIAHHTDAVASLAYAFINGGPTTKTFEVDVPAILDMYFPFLNGIEGHINKLTNSSFINMTMIVWIMKTFNNYNWQEILSGYTVGERPESLPRLNSQLLNKISYAEAAAKTAILMLQSEAPVDSRLGKLCMLMSMYNMAMFNSYPTGFPAKLLFDSIINYVTSDFELPNSLNPYDVFVTLFGQEMCNTYKALIWDITTSIMDTSAITDVMSRPQQNPAYNYYNNYGSYCGNLSKTFINQANYNSIKPDLYARNNSAILDYSAMDNDPEKSLFDCYDTSSRTGNVIINCIKAFEYCLPNSHLSHFYNACVNIHNVEQMNCIAIMSAMAEIQIFLFGDTKINIKQITGLNDLSGINFDGLRHESMLDVAKIHLTRY